ncbi:MAG: hypothetical protein JJE52_12705 [Acidimicrobiia bacterium]|nr:hypothetical protein [Acidimicrobiia bacterium]
MTEPRSDDQNDDLPDQLQGEELEKDPAPGQRASDTDVQAERQPDDSPD